MDFALCNSKSTSINTLLAPNDFAIRRIRRAGGSVEFAVGSGGNMRRKWQAELCHGTLGSTFAPENLQEANG